MKQKLNGRKFSETIRIDSVFTIFYNEFSSDFIFDGERHDDLWEMVYVDKGTALVQAEEQKLRLNQGEIIFHKPNEFHAIRADKNDPPNVVVVSFTTRSEAMNLLAGVTCVIPKALRFHITEILKNARMTFIMPLKHRLKLLDDPVFGGEQMIKTNLEQLFIELIRGTIKADDKDGRHIYDNETVAKCIRYLEENLYGSITVDEVRDAVNYSRTYICTLFRSVTGKTIINYYNELKIEEAKKLIRKNVYTFSEISDMLGFSTPAYFSHQFSRITNMTPSQYRDSLM